LPSPVGLISLKFPQLFLKISGDKFIFSHEMLFVVSRDRQLDEIFLSTLRDLIRDEGIIGRIIEEPLQERGSPPLHSLRFRGMRPPWDPMYQKEILSIAEGCMEECKEARDIVKHLMGRLIRYFERIDRAIGDESLRVKVKGEFIRRIIRFYAEAGRA